MVAATCGLVPLVGIVLVTVVTVDEVRTGWRPCDWRGTSIESPSGLVSVLGASRMTASDWLRGFSATVKADISGTIGLLPVPVVPVLVVELAKACPCKFNGFAAPDWGFVSMLDALSTTSCDWLIEGLESTIGVGGDMVWKIIGSVNV